MHKESLQKAWEESDKAPFLWILRSTAGEDLGEVLAGREDWRRAFDSENKEKVLICSDERVMPAAGEFKVGIAGQLILCSQEEQAEFVENYRGKIKVVRSHSGCGAAGVAYEKLSAEEREKYQDGDGPADEYGKLFSANLAERLDARFEHLPFSGMRGSNGFHDARMIFWSTDPAFDPSELVGKFLPPHFLANGLAFGLGEGYAQEELKILTDIALGHHGFGELFNDRNPFYVISIGRDAKNLNKIAKETLGGFGDRVSFKYFRA